MTNIQQRKDRATNIVLVADDDLFTRSVLKVALQDMAEIVEAESGSDVLSLYKKHNPDVVLLDYHMPGKNSHMVLREIMAYDKSAYIIMISADAVAMTVQATHNDGAKAFITKPFSKESILKHVLLCPTILFGYGDKDS